LTVGSRADQGAASAGTGDVDTEVAERAARRIAVLRETGDDDALVIPRATAIIFAQILELLAQGRGVQIIPKAAELTTRQAADMLNVARPYLHRAGGRDIPYRRASSEPVAHLLAGRWTLAVLGELAAAGHRNLKFTPSYIENQI
jgi:hypothetical protein